MLSLVWHYTLGLLLIVHCGIVASSDDWTTGLKVVLTPHTSHMPACLSLQIKIFSVAFISFLFKV